MTEPDPYLAVLKALYDYESTSEDELSIKEDQLLFLVEKTDEEWWKVKQKTDSQEDDPTLQGLVPASYVEEVEPSSVVKALYDYTAVAGGELSIVEGDMLLAYDKEDEWILVKVETDGGKVGYVPGNYVEESTREGEPVEKEASRIVIPDSPPRRPVSTYVDPADRVAATTDKAKADGIKTWAVSEIDKKGKKKKGTLGVGNGAIFFASESDKTPVQKWQTSAIEIIKVEKSKHLHLDIGGPTPVNLHFNAGSKDTTDEIVKKLQSSKSLSLDGLTSRPKSTSPPPNTAIPTSQSPESLSTSASRAGSRPNRNGASVHFAQTPAVIPVPDTQGDEDEDEGLPIGEMGSALYDFTADGEDELSVTEGEQLIILDKESSDEWWKCRNTNGAEGVVPASYIEVAGGISEVTHDDGGSDSEAREQVAQEQADREEAEREAERAAAEAEVLAARARERVEKERERKKQETDRQAKAAAALAAKAEKERRDKDSSSRAAPEAEGENKRTRDSRKSREDEITPKTLTIRSSVELPTKFPNAGKTRMWHDRSGQWRTEAEFLGINKGKIRLHKINGVVIEVPPEKMSADDVRYIESITKQDLSSHIPRSRHRDDDNVPLGSLASKGSRPAPPPKRPQTDWFEFFLNAGCEIDDCTRYAASFERDKIDEVILPDIKESTLRSIGLREGDIIRVMKAIEKRKPKEDGSDDALKAQLSRDEELARALQAEEDRGSSTRRSAPAPNLFAGPGGALKPRRGRPQPRGSAPPVNVDVNSIVSASDQILRTSSPRVGSPGAQQPPPNTSVPKPAVSTQPSGFDDDAWTNRPSSTKPPASTSPALPPPAPTPPAAATLPAAPVLTAPSTSTPTPAVASSPQAPPPPPASAPASSPKQDSGQFEILAKIGQMRPVPPSQPPAIATSSPANVPLHPQSFQSGLGMGSSPIPIGQHLQNQQTGIYAQQPDGLPRGPLAPVPANQGLLNPLVPTTSNFNSFVPTRPQNNPPLQPPVQPSFISSPPVEYVQSGLLLQQPTGFPGMMPQQTGIFPAVAAQPTGLASTPNFMPPPGFGGLQPNNATFNPQLLQASMSGGNLAPIATVSPQKDHSPAAVFAQMKSGTFGEESGPQASDKYDALRSQPMGVLYQINGSHTQGPYSGY